MVDHSLTGENKTNKRKSNYLILSWGGKSSGKKQKHSILTATHKFLPSLTMPYDEIGDDFCSLDCDPDASDINLSSSSSPSSFATSSSSSSFSSAYSAAGVEVGASTDDPSPKMEKDPRKIARRFDFQFFSRLSVHLRNLHFPRFACFHDSVSSFFRFCRSCKFVA